MVKSKVRFDGLDVAAMVAHWNRVAVGRRVINIYDGNTGDRYLFKLDKQSGNDTNMLLLLESGIRLHTTNESYENAGMPSPFCSKLRKHLRGLRLENVQQLGRKDRVVMLTFGSGESQRHSLIVEFYARGNLVLTNANYVILALLRSHDYDGQVKVQVGHAYPITYATTVQTPEEVHGKVMDTLLTVENPMEWAQAHIVLADEAAAPVGGKKKKGGDANNAWRTLLLQPEMGISHYGPSLIEHCLLTAEINPRQHSPKTLDEPGWKKLQEVLLTEGERILKDLEIADAKGYIFYQPKENEQKDDDEKNKPPMSPYDDKLLLEFQPHVLKQHDGMLRLEFESFDLAVDAFFAQIESQKRMIRAETQQSMAEQRLEKIRKDQESRIQQLLEQEESLKLQAQVVETHAEMIDKAIQVVNSALDSGMDWDQLEDLVKVEQEQNRNPVALLIQRLDLEHDAIVLRLQRFDVDDDSEKTMDVSIDLNDTAFGNASTMFAKYRASKEKGQKTIEASEKAMQAAEDSAQRQLNDAKKRKGNIVGAMQTKRKPLWFEKFNWFITSDNYLVIGGRDAQQNEVVVKRYLRAGDAYLHADVHGAASCILRAKRRRTSDGKTQTLPLSEQALREAGSFTICRSSAWSSKMVTSAWWVEAHQVSKTAPTGEFLTVGSFMIRGKKNYLPPSQLEMGLGVLFRLGDDEGIARHKNERRDFALMQLEEQDEEAPTSADELQARSEDLRTEQASSTEPKSEETGEAGEDTQEAGGASSMKDDNSEEMNSGENSLEEEPQDSDEENTEQAKPKKGLSIKERKLIKKYGSLEAAEAAEEERLKVEQSIGVKAKGNTETTNKQQDAPKRGKKTKLKRITTKYADQDEEDRELALLALHAGEKYKKKEKKREPEMNETAREAAAQTMAILKKDASLVANQLPTEVKETLAKCVMPQISNTDEPPVPRWDKFDAEALEQLLGLDLQAQQVAAAKRLLALKESTRIDNFSASLGGIIRAIRKYGHEGLETEASSASGRDAAKRKTKAVKEDEKETWRQTLAGEGVVDEEVDDDAVDDTIELGKLTGKPNADDLILFAVPVCAPYQTLSQYAYRAKLTPGNMKRGKAASACIEIFTKEEQKTPLTERNKELIKKVADTEWVAAIIGDVRITAAGAGKVTQKQKGKKDKGGKKK
jgi:predicted ribosome quality control (RQC) complex YloA/Tae2 family protein